MRVLHVIPRLAVQCGGPVTAVLGMTSALKAAGVDVRLIATDHWGNGIPEKIDCDTRIFRCRLGAWKWSPELGRALPDEVLRADVVTLHTLWSYPVSAAGRACRTYGIPYIVRPCGMLDTWSLSQKRLKKRIYSSLIERRNINGAAAIWFTSEEERKGAQGFKYTAPDTVLPLGLSPEAYSSLPARGSFRAARPELGKSRLILFLGRITRKKQTSLLIRAFSRLRAEFPDTALVIAGPDEAAYLRELKQLAESLRVNDRTFFTGELRGTEVQAAFVDSEVFALPSLHENFGVSVIEAMACGVPVVISKLVDLAFDVAGAGAGLTINPTEFDLTAGLRRLLSNRSLAREMGAAGRRLARDRFTWKGIIPSLIDLYEKVINRDNSSVGWPPPTIGEGCEEAKPSLTVGLVPEGSVRMIDRHRWKPKN